MDLTNLLDNASNPINSKKKKRETISFDLTDDYESAVWEAITAASLKLSLPKNRLVAIILRNTLCKESRKESEKS